MNRLKNTKNIAVIGCGHWGKNLIRNLSQLDHLYAICDNSPDALDKFRELDDLKFFRSYEELLKDNNINAVAISSPAETHYEIVKASLLADKDIFVEKPLSLKTDEAQELAQLALQQKKILMVDHLLQYHPAIVELKRLVDAKVLGKLQYLYSNRLNIGRLRKEENILWSFAPHDISVLLNLVNQVPLKVRAFGEAYLQKDVYDTTLTDLTFSESLKAHIFVSWLHPFKEQKLVVIGDKNMAVFDDLADNKLVLYPHKVEWVQHVPMASKASGEVIPVKNTEPLREACLHFIDCIKHRKTPKTDANEAVAVLDVLQQAQESLDEESPIRKKRFIDVPS